MRTSRMWALAAGLVVIPALLAGPPAAGETAGGVNVLGVELGTLGGHSVGLAVSTSGVVFGDINTEAGASHVFSYDLLSGGPLVDLGVLDGETNASVLGVTSGGVVLGQSGDAVFTYDTAATSPQMTALPFPADATTNPWMDADGYAVMNDVGWIAGEWGDDNDAPPFYRNYIYNPNTPSVTDIGAIGEGFPFTDMNAVKAVGTIDLGNDAYTGFVQPLSGGSRIELNTQFEWDESYANGINDAGWVVGEYRVGEHWFGFAWDQVADPVTLPLRGSVYNTPSVVNDDWIIGQEEWPASTAVAYSLQDLNAAPTLVGELKFPKMISDAGVVVGEVDGQAAVYDLGAAASSTIVLPALGGVQSFAEAIETVGGHPIVAGAIRPEVGADRAVAWVLGVPDAPTISLVADTDGIAPVGSVTADTTPTLAGTSEPAGPVVVRNGEGVVLTTVTADSTTGAWSYTSATTLTDGSYQFSATYEPTTGWPSNAATASVTVETIPAPTVTIGSPKVQGSTVTVPFTVSGIYEPGSLTCQLDEAAPLECASVTGHTFTDVPKGDHAVTVRAATPAGLIGQDSTTFTVKSGKIPAPAPSVLAVTITDLTAAKSGTITATFSAQAGTSPYTFSCTLTEGTTMITREECTSPWTYPNEGSALTRGRYQLSVTVTDSATAPATATSTATVNVPASKT